MDDPTSENKPTKTTGDRIALALLFTFFAISAFAMNPPGWGWFDTLAVCAFSLFAVWHLAHAFLGRTPSDAASNKSKPRDLQ